MPNHLVKTRDRDRIEARSPLPVVSEYASSNSLDISNETVTFADGAAGTTQKLKLAYSGILSENGERIGGFITDLTVATPTDTADTSLSFTTGTVLTTEVKWTYSANHENDTDADRLSDMSNGEYMVNYEQGYILGKSAITTSSTTDTVSYKVNQSLVRNDRDIIRTLNVGRKAVTTAGTAVPLATSSTPFNILTVQALVGNTDLVFIGNSSVVAADGSELGIGLGQLTTKMYYGGDLADIYIDCLTGNTDGVSFEYTT